MATILTCTGFLSVRTRNYDQQRVWTLISHNQPHCADNPSLEDVLEVARKVFGNNATLACWDGDVGEFTSEISTKKEQP